MDNDSLYHVRKRGIMMRTVVGEDLRKHIIKTMVKYVDEGGKKGIPVGENIEKQNAVRVNKGLVVKPKKRWFQFMACFTSTPDS